MTEIALAPIDTTASIDARNIVDLAAGFIADPPSLSDFRFDNSLPWRTHELSQAAPGAFPTTEEAFSRYQQRSLYIQRFGFSIPTREAIEAVKALGPLVEVGAGTGYWSAMLAAQGADIIATDLKPPTRAGNPYAFDRLWTDVRTLGATAAIRRWPERHVFCSWPSYDARWATLAARAIAPGQALALIHEGQGGCVGHDSLFDLLDRDFTEEAEIAIPQWPGLHDRLNIWRKRP